MTAFFPKARTGQSESLCRAFYYLPVGNAGGNVERSIDGGRVDTLDTSHGLHNRRLDAGRHSGNDPQVKRTCARCGKEYEGALHSRYCGRSCQSKAYRERKHYGNARTSNELRTCARCGVQFEGALHGRYHSGACKQAAYRERKQRQP